MKTAVVILNWNSRDYLRRFLPGLLASCEGMDAEVIVADSASTDGSMELMASSFPGVRTIPLDRNYGFTGGYDRALAQVDADYYVLINSDVDVPAGWLAPLVDWMDSHPGCGVCGPKLHRLEADGTRTDEFEYAGAAGGYLDRYCYPFCRGRVPGRTEKDRGQYDLPHDVMWVSGACMMVRSSLWKTAGGLDDLFFAHMEEIDFCWRAQLRGYSVTVVPESTVYHIGGGTLPRTSAFKLRLNYRNNLLMMRKNLAATVGPCTAACRMAVRHVLDSGSAAVYLLTGRVSFFRAVCQAYADYFRMRGQVERRTAAGSSVKGLLPVRILLASAVYRNRVFKYLNRYEGIH